jgi:hypothetical protein
MNAGAPRHRIVNGEMKRRSSRFNSDMPRNSDGKKALKNGPAAVNYSKKGGMNLGNTSTIGKDLPILATARELTARETGSAGGEKCSRCLCVAVKTRTIRFIRVRCLSALSSGIPHGCHGFNR